MTVRCTPAQRAVINRMRVEQTKDPHRVIHCVEPALGSLDERLGIIVRRLGGRTGPLPRLTETERQQYRVKEGPSA